MHGLKGPFTLNERSILDNVDDHFFGVFALSVQANGQLRRVGRGILRDQLFHFINQRIYREFYFDYVATEREGFEKECQIWHASGAQRMDSNAHPSPDVNASWECPKCGVFYEGA